MICQCEHISHRNGQTDNPEEKFFWCENEDTIIISPFYTLCLDCVNSMGYTDNPKLWIFQDTLDSGMIWHADKNDGLTFNQIRWGTIQGFGGDNR